METMQTEEFAEWFAGMRDRKARSKVAQRIVRIESGNMGDVRSLGGGLSEAKINFGPGYRLYFTLRGLELVVLLIGGDKGSQARDIDKARDILDKL